MLCYSPRHDASLGTLDATELAAVVGLWRAETVAHGEHSWVQIFENRGAMMDCSSEHPHGQLWASHFVPELPRREDVHQHAYFTENGSPLLSDYGERESADGARVVCGNDRWLAIVPFWAA